MIPYQELHAIMLGPLHIPLYTLMASISIILGLVILLAESRNKSLSIRQGIWLYLFVLAGLFFGARFFYMAGPWYEGNSNIWYRLIIAFIPWSKAGLVMYGGLLGGLALGWIYIRINKLPFWAYADIFAAAGALGMMIARYGCFFVNCCKTKQSNVPWAVLHNGIPYHPSPTYESLFFLALFVLLLIIRQRQRFEGQLFLAFITFYPVARFFIEMTRYYPVKFFGLTASQLISIALFAIFLPIYITKYMKSKAVGKWELTKKESIGWQAYALIIAGGFLMTFSVYMVSAWSQIYSLLLFSIGLTALAVGLGRAFKIKLKDISGMAVLKSILAGFVILIIIFSSSAIILNSVGRAIDSEDRKRCPYSAHGSNDAEVAITYFSSPYCSECWVEELLVLPKIEKELGGIVLLERYDTRHCKEQARHYLVDNAPGIAVAKGSDEIIYYNYRSFEQIKEDIDRLKSG